MDILRIATAGSVDDGKSTLIGRLLHDTGSITNDKLEAVAATSRRKGLDFVDLSLLTDGLVAEREQGITIDVAHIYFATGKRKYIIADTPGHFEYTRNMITGASASEASIILIDARQGVVEQTRRHLYIASLLRLNHVIVCINKMDLVEFAEDRFVLIRNSIKALADHTAFEGSLHFIPVAAKEGDNVVQRSRRMPWYNGNTLLEHLEQLPVNAAKNQLPTRFAVQLVIRPHTDVHHDFRGYAGKLLSGVLRVGQEVLVLPSLRSSRIKALWHSQEEIQQAEAGQSVTIELDDDVDLGRGNMIVPADAAFVETKHLEAVLTWMDEQPLTSGKTFLLQHGVHRVKARVTALQNRIDLASMEETTSVASFTLNDIGRVQIKTAAPVFPDTYQQNRHNGAFILIDEYTNNTVAVGFINAF